MALLVANAFFVAVEFAVIASRRSRIEGMGVDDTRRGAAALSAMSEVSLQLSGAQLGITMASLGLGAVAEPAVGHLVEGLLEAVFPDMSAGVVHTIGFIGALAIVVFVHMVFGEMVPKNVAIAGPERTLLWLAVPNRAYQAMFSPVVRGLNWLGNLGVRALGREPRDELDAGHTAEQLSWILAASHEHGLIEQDDSDLLGAALDFGQREIRTVMVPSAEIAAVAADDSVATMEEAVSRHGHTRLPVVTRSLEDATGFVHVKDLLGADGATRDRPVDPGLVRPLVQVVGHHTLHHALVIMRRERVHLALVRRGRPDGPVIGLVTLEDIVEELVGEIRDETDVAVDR
jgi:CBS domain containing-hemolysin-like protein